MVVVAVGASRFSSQPINLLLAIASEVVQVQLLLLVSAAVMNLLLLRSCC